MNSKHVAFTTIEPREDVPLLDFHSKWRCMASCEAGKPTLIRSGIATASRVSHAGSAAVSSPRGAPTLVFLFVHGSIGSR